MLAFLNCLFPISQLTLAPLPTLAPHRTLAQSDEGKDLLDFVSGFASEFGWYRDFWVFDYSAFKVGAVSMVCFGWVACVYVQSQLSEPCHL